MDTQGTIGIKATLDISEMQRNVQKYVRNINMMQDHTDVASQSVAKSFPGCKLPELHSFRLIWRKD